MVEMAHDSLEGHSEFIAVCLTHVTGSRSARRTSKLSRRPWACTLQTRECQDGYKAGRVAPAHRGCFGREAGHSEVRVPD
jgi:hypothetical protein